MLVLISKLLVTFLSGMSSKDPKINRQTTTETIRYTIQRMAILALLAFAFGSEEGVVKMLFRNVDSEEGVVNMLFRQPALTDSEYNGDPL